MGLFNLIRRFVEPSAAPMPQSSTGLLAMPEARGLLGYNSKEPYDPKAPVPDVLVRRLHEACSAIGMNSTMIGYEIEEMRTVGGYLEYLNYLTDRIRRLQ